MAKSAKQIQIEITDRDVNKYVDGIQERYANIESARGAFMRQARSERDGMTAIYESLAAKGIPQKIAKIEIEIIRLIEKIKSKFGDLDREERKLVERLARAQGDRKQLSLLLEVPPPPKAEKTEKPAKLRKVKAPKLNVVPITQSEESDAPSAA